MGVVENGSRVNRFSLKRAALAVPLLLALVVGAVHVLRDRTALTVWSCGGNYESLKEYIQTFEAQEHCRVRYTAAPVAYLLDRAVSDPHPPDVLVGRAGPGWLALKEAGRLVGHPTFFAVDPLVIAVPKGNPGGIAGIEDLGRDGVRVAMCSRAMRPKSKVPSLFMAAVSSKYFPGLVERWENNAVANARCGREYLRTLVRGDADAAVAPSSLLTYPAYRGKLDRIPIPAKYILCMKKGRPSMPQCAGVLQTGRGMADRHLAECFVSGLSHNPDWLHEHGYLALTDPEAEQLSDLLRINRPKDMEGWQCHLAALLEEYGLCTEARRRYLKVLYTFGPNHYSARALCHTGKLNAAMGNSAFACSDWGRVLTQFPPSKPVEYDIPALVSVAFPTPIERMPYEYWIQDAEREIQAAGGEGIPLSGSVCDRVLLRYYPMTMTEGDPPKNGTREFALGIHLLMCGDPAFATRDLLKVVTLNAPSRYMPDAEYLLGVCAMARDLPDVALAQWRRVVERYPDTAVAKEATKRLVEEEGKIMGDQPPVDQPPVGGDEERLDSHPERGMTYGIRLSEHQLPLFAFKEMMKVVSDIYGRHTFGSEARYRAGRYLLQLGNTEAAALQWRLCCGEEEDGCWQHRAKEELHALLAEVTEQGSLLTSLPKTPPNSFGKRLRLAEEFWRAGVHDEGQIIMEYLKALTVALPPRPEKFAPLLALAHTRLAACLARAGMPDKAMKEWQFAAESFPDTPAGKKAVMKLAETDGRAAE